MESSDDDEDLEEGWDDDEMSGPPRSKVISPAAPSFLTEYFIKIIITEKIEQQQEQESKYKSKLFVFSSKSKLSSY